MMSEPLDLEPTRREGRALLAEVERLRAEVARQAEQITAVRVLAEGALMGTRGLARGGRTVYAAHILRALERAS